MDKLWQLLPLFVTGFLVSRIMARTGLAESALQWFFRKSGGRFGLLLLALLMATILLSLFIPNMLTVLALLPLLERLIEQLRSLGEDAAKLATPLILALIYGANIGGMGSLVGSPANALMLMFLEAMQVPGRERLNFLSWLLWGLPLVLVFGLLAWGLLLWLLVPNRQMGLKLHLSDPSGRGLARHRLFGARLSLWTAAFWLVLSFVTAVVPSLRTLWDGLAVLFGVSFVWAVFGLTILEDDGSRRPLLHWSDCYSGLPWRGLFLAGAAVGLSFGLYQLGVPDALARGVKELIPVNVSPFWLYLSLILATTFITEVISNTAASVALFPIAYKLAVTLGWHPLPAVMGVALASTCAFMSPLATPSTGLAFGGVRGVSLWRMLGLGFLTNLLGGVWLALLLTFVLPKFYHLPVAISP